MHGDIGKFRLCKSTEKNCSAPGQRYFAPAREENMDRLPYEIEVAPAGGDPVFAQREAGVAHTPYETEKVFYSCIRAGDAEGVKRFFDDYLSQGIVVGSMSADPLTQMKYFAVCCITLACRYAIAGGLEEKFAFNFSDECIRRVDGMKKGEERAGSAVLPTERDRFPDAVSQVRP